MTGVRYRLQKFFVNYQTVLKLYWNRSLWLHRVVAMELTNKDQTLRPTTLYLKDGTLPEDVDLAKKAVVQLYL